MYHDGTFGTEEMIAQPQEGPAPYRAFTQQHPGAQSLIQEDSRCNGSLLKQTSPQPGEDSSLQRYSADPTVFLPERGARRDADVDGYMTSKQDKLSSGTKKYITALLLSVV